MTADTWETFTARLLGIGLGAAQGLIRIALVIVIAYAITKLLRAALKRLGLASNGKLQAMTK